MPTSRKLRSWSLTLGILIGGLLIVRAAMGPFSVATIHIGSPFALEAGIVLVAVILGRKTIVGRIPSDKSHPQQPTVYLAIVIALVWANFAQNLAAAFLSDDYVLLTQSSTFSWQDFVSSWVTGGGDGAFRPVGYAYFALYSRIAGFSTVRWHAASIAIHALNVTLIWLLGRAVWKCSRSASFAALCFGLHGTRPEVVTWTAGTFDLLAVLFSLISLCLAFIGRDRSTLIFAPCALAVAILCKESAYATPLMAITIAVAFGIHREVRFRNYMWSSALACLILVVYRWCLFGGPGGYLTNGRPMIFSVTLLGVIKALFVRYWLIMLFPMNWDASPSVFLAFGLTIWTALLFAAKPQFSKATSVLLFGSALCILPAIHLALVGADLQGSRIYYLPSMCFCLGISGLAVGWRCEASFVRYFAFTAIALSLLMASNLGIWREASALATSACADVRNSTIPMAHKGVYVFANGLTQCRELNARH